MTGREAGDWRPTEVTRAGSGADAGARGLAGYLRSTGNFDDLLLQAKALVFRDFRVEPDDLDPVLDVLAPHRLGYVHGNSPRTRVGRNVYTSTEYPSRLDISMHNELSYAHRWPARLVFFCAQAPESGGATPVADGARWLAGIDAEIRAAFAGGVRYTQNLHGGYGFGKSWQDTFETDDRSAVEEYLAGGEAAWEWKPDGGLRVTQTRPATAFHPRQPNVEVWFNQADQWHPAGMGEDGAALAEILPEDELPSTVCFADGVSIPADYITHIAEAGWRAAVDVTWHQGDLLVIDNVLTAHGRRAYTGARRVLVAMSD